MTSFRRGYGNTRNGYPLINLDHAHILKPLKNQHDGMLDGYAAIDAQGEEIGRIDGGVPDEDGTVIPDATGTHILLFWLKDDDTADFVRLPVIAWFVPGDGAYGVQPIIYEELGEHWCLETKNGTLMVPNDRSLADIGTALQYFQESLHRARESRRVRIAQAVTHDAATT